MNWSIHHCMIPAHETARTGAFLRDVFELEPLEFESPPGLANPIDREHLLVYVDADGRELHVVKPMPGFSQRNPVPLNPTTGHVAFSVDDIETVERRLKAGGWTYGNAGEVGPGGRTRIYFYDPYMNVLEVNQKL